MQGGITMKEGELSWVPICVILCILELSELQSSSEPSPPSSCSANIQQPEEHRAFHWSLNLEHSQSTGMRDVRHPGGRRDKAAALVQRRMKERTSNKTPPFEASLHGQTCRRAVLQHAPKGTEART